VLLFILLSMVVAFVTGWIVDRLVAPETPGEPECRRSAEGLPHPPGALGRAALAETRARELSQSRPRGIGRIAHGVALDLLRLRPDGPIRAFVPEEIFQQYFGPTVAGLFLTLAGDDDP
jgi:uncharacterized protein